MNLSKQQMKLMFGLIGSGFAVDQITPTNHITLSMANEKTITKIVLIPKSNQDEKSENKAG